MIKAWTEQANGRKDLKAKFYIPRRPHLATLLTDLDDGLIDSVSLGFRAPRTHEKAPGEKAAVPADGGKQTSGIEGSAKSTRAPASKYSFA